MIRNLTATDRCPYCEDDAQVFVGWSQAGTDEMAPCPKCERGDRLENATTRLVAADKGKTIERPREIPEPWKGGYWQGRPTAGVQPVTHSKPLSRAETLKRFKEAGGRLAKAMAERSTAMQGKQNFK